MMAEIKPSIRQSTEESLVDTANLLAEVLKAPVKNQQTNTKYWTNIFDRYNSRELNATIWGNLKSSAHQRIYVTDHNGLVLLDSQAKAVGKDFSKWRDVNLTLRGQYGARSTIENPKDPNSTVMYVAAPIKDKGEIIGVVTVAKPNETLAPYIAKAQHRLMYMMSVFIGVAISLGALLAWWFGRDMKRLQEFAHEASRGNRENINPKSFPRGEMRLLAKAMSTMRQELDGKTYVENYVQSLTHELKSPLAGITASLEILLQEKTSASQQEKFLSTINNESKRLNHLVDRVLKLAQLEAQEALINTGTIDIRGCIEQLFSNLKTRTDIQKIRIKNEVPKEWTLNGDPFLIELALSNLFENAIRHCAYGGLIHIYISDPSGGICVFNQGDLIPSYALGKLTDRFYSLPNKDSNRRSSGLGLTLVSEIAALHHGSFNIKNHQNGVLATLICKR